MDNRRPRGARRLVFSIGVASAGCRVGRVCLVRGARGQAAQTLGLPPHSGRRLISRVGCGSWPGHGGAARGVSRFFAKPTLNRFAGKTNLAREAGMAGGWPKVDRRVGRGGPRGKAPPLPGTFPACGIG